MFQKLINLQQPIRSGLSFLQPFPLSLFPLPPASHIPPRYSASFHSILLKLAGQKYTPQINQLGCTYTRTAHIPALHTQSIAVTSSLNSLPHLPFPRTDPPTDRQTDRRRPAISRYLSVMLRPFSQCIASGLPPHSDRGEA